MAGVVPRGWCERRKAKQRLARVCKAGTTCAAPSARAPMPECQVTKQTCKRHTRVPSLAQVCCCASRLQSLQAWLCSGYGCTQPIYVPTRSKLHVMPRFTCTFAAFHFILCCAGFSQVWLLPLVAAAPPLFLCLMNCASYVAAMLRCASLFASYAAAPSFCLCLCLFAVNIFASCMSSLCTPLLRACVLLRLDVCKFKS